MDGGRFAVCSHCKLLCRTGKLANAYRSWRRIWRHDAALSRAVSGAFPQGAIASGIALVLAFPALWLCLFASGIVGRRAALDDASAARGATAEDDFADSDDEEDDSSSGGISQYVGALTHTMLSASATFKRLTGLNRRKPREDEYGDMRGVRRSAETRNSARRDPGFNGASSAEPPFDTDQDFDGDMEAAPLAGEEWHDAPPQRAKARVGERAPAPKSGARIQREAQPSFLKEGGAFEMPSLHYLAEPKLIQRDSSLSRMRSSRMRVCLKVCWKILACAARSST